MHSGLDCGRVPKLTDHQKYQNESYISNTRFPNSVSVICEIGYIFNNGAYFLQMKCNENGVWSQINEDCLGTIIRTSLLFCST